MTLSQTIQLRFFHLMHDALNKILGLAIFAQNPQSGAEDFNGFDRRENLQKEIKHGLNFALTESSTPI